MKPNRELTAIESALAQQVAALTNRVAELEVLLRRALNESARVHPDFADDINAAIDKARQT